MREVAGKVLDELERIDPISVRKRSGHAGALVHAASGEVNDGWLKADGELKFAAAS